MSDTLEHASEMLGDMSGEEWVAQVTLGGLSQISKPGWEITRMTETHYQAIAISSLYRFVGIGKTPSTALAEAYGHMREFSKELKRHMEAT